MENATKALSIAGAILITIIVLALGVQVYNGIRQMPMSEEERKEAEEIEKFNSKFNVYNNKPLYQAEFKSVINKIVDNNTLVGQDRRVSMVNARVEMSDGTTYEDLTYIQENLVKSDTLSHFWKCTKIEYDENGRVSKMTFKEVKEKAPTVDPP